MQAETLEAITAVALTDKPSINNLERPSPVLLHEEPGFSFAG